MPNWTNDDGSCSGCPSGCIACTSTVSVLPGGSFMRLGRGGQATTWCRHDSEQIEIIRYKLRYDPTHVTPSEMMLAAEALCSYAALVEKPTKRRSAVIRALKIASRTAQPSPASRKEKSE